MESRNYENSSHLPEKGPRLSVCRLQPTPIYRKTRIFWISPRSGIPDTLTNFMKIRQVVSEL